MRVRSTCRGPGSLEVDGVDTRELHEDVLEDAQGTPAVWTELVEERTRENRETSVALA